MAGRQGSGLGMAAAEIFDGANYIYRTGSS